MTDILQEAVNALVLAKGNKSEAARALSLPRPTLVSRLEKAKLNSIKPTAKAPDMEAALTEQKLTYELQVRELKQQVEELAKESMSSCWLNIHQNHPNGYIHLRHKKDRLVYRHFSFQIFTGER